MKLFGAVVQICAGQLSVVLHTRNSKEDFAENGERT